MLFAFIALLMTAWNVFAIEEPASAGIHRPIQFKPEPSISDASDVKAFVVLAVLLALLIPLLYWIRKRYPSLGMAGNSRSKIKIIETRAISPRLTVHLIEVNGEEILLAQGGDQLIQLRRSSTESHGTDRHENA